MGEEHNHILFALETYLGSHDGMVAVIFLFVRGPACFVLQTENARL